MPDLPDLPTSEISVVAFWNAIDDGGVNSIDPETALDDPAINSYEIYDNGIDITSYTANDKRTCHARIKSDGWVIAWLDRTEETGSGSSGGYADGWFDVVEPWTSPTDSQRGLLPDMTTLPNVIFDLAGNLDKSSGMVFLESAVDYYNYEHHADAITFMATAAAGSNKTSGFSYTSNTKIEDAKLLASRENIGDSRLLFDSPLTTTEPILSQSDPYDKWAVVDLQDNGLIPDPSTDYTLTLESGSNLAMQINCVVIILWSDTS